VRELQRRQVGMARDKMAKQPRTAGTLVGVNHVVPLTHTSRRSTTAP